MKKVLALITILIASIPALAQQKVSTTPDCRRDFSFTAAGVSSDFDNRSTACTSWLFVYQSNGFSVISIEFQAAPDSNQAAGAYVTWPNLASGSLPLTSTVGGSISGFKYNPWVRVKLTTATGTGQLNGTLLGWRPFPGQDALGAIGATANQIQGNTAAGSTVTGNPVTVQGTDSNQSAATGNPVVIGAFEANGGTARRVCGFTPVSDRTISYVGATCHTLFDLFTGGTLWDRPWAASLTNFIPSTTLTARNSTGAALTEKGSRWTVVSTPAVSNQASASIASEAAVRHVADCVTFSGGSTTAPALTKLTVDLRDGASGAGTVIRQWTVIVSASTGQNIPPFSECGLNLTGTTATAMTLEFSGLLTNLFETVSISGYNVN